MDIKSLHPGSCHCGAVQFDVELPHGLDQLRRCNCSMCRRRGTIVASVPLTGIHIKQGEDKLSLYQFNTMTARHYFCSVCGIYTHHQRRSNPDEYGINVACLEGVDPSELTNVVLLDGVHHPSDQP